MADAEHPRLVLHNFLSPDLRKVNFTTFILLIFVLILHYTDTYIGLGSDECWLAGTRVHTQELQHNWV